jgi:hypothetical protein
MLGKLDSEIRDAETRIARERHNLAGSLHDTTQRVRTSIVSPQALAAFAVAGFILGDLTRTRRTRAPEARQTLRSSVLGLLMSGAMALIKAQYGSPWSFAAEMMGKANARRPGPAPERPASSDAGVYDAAEDLPRSFVRREPAAATVRYH